MGRLVMHQQAVHETFQIQSLLLSPDLNSPIQVVAWEMEDLSLLLGALRIGCARQGGFQNMRLSR